MAAALIISTGSSKHAPQETDSLLPTTNGFRRGNGDRYHSQRIKKEEEKKHVKWVMLIPVAVLSLLLMGILILIIVAEDDASSNIEKERNASNVTTTTTYHDAATGLTWTTTTTQQQANSNNSNTNYINHDRDWWMSTPHVETLETVIPGRIPLLLPTGKTAPPPQQQQPLRWGVLGLGRIAHDFSTALKMSGAHITAVAAGSLPNATGRAQAFAKLYGVPTSYGTYEELATDPNVDIVYIATINSLHYNNTLLMLEAGKNVLLEKPMAMNLEQAQGMARAAQTANRLLVTNFWTRFFPVTKYVRSVVQQRRLGDIVAMRGDFGFPAPLAPNGRLLNRTQGGGAMLDLGCYLVNLAVMVNSASSSSFTKVSLPEDVQASSLYSYGGTNFQVDTETSFFWKWNNNVQEPGNLTTAAKPSSSISSTTTSNSWIMSGQVSFRRPSSFEVEIEGTHGRVLIHGPANAPTGATIYEHEPFGPLKRIEYIQSELPFVLDAKYGPQEYPRAAGFGYIIHEIEKCMLERGIPGRMEHGQTGCLELKALTMEEQLQTARITYDVMEKAGYWQR